VVGVSVANYQLTRSARRVAAGVAGAAATSASRLPAAVRCTIMGKLTRPREEGGPWGTSSCSELSPIEPSQAGGAKIAAAIARVVATHDFARQETVIYGWPAG
jgi:hypothetical protein